MTVIKGRGGVAIPPGKNLTMDKEIRETPLPDSVVIPMQMHLGAPAKLIVDRGDIVHAGQLIGEPTGKVSAAIHSSVSGTVTKIEPRLLPSGAKAQCAEIKVDKDDSFLERPETNLAKLGPEDIVARVQAAGVVGLGGAGFPTYIKLIPPPDAKIDTFIINGCECEPYLTCDYRLMLEHSKELLEGAKLIMRTVGAEEAFIGIEEDKSDAIKLYEDVGSGFLKVVRLPSKYPQGAEARLIKSALGRNVPTGKLPSSVGALVQNVATTVAVANACHGLPLVERILTVSGVGIAEPSNLRFRVGTSVRHLLESSGGLNEMAAKVVHGGPMMGTALFNLDVPAVKTTSGLIALPESDADSLGHVEPCIRCGSCIDRCPQALRPLLLASYIEKGMIGKALEEGLMDCIECGSCAYGCSAGRPIVQLIRYGKQLADEKRKSG